jgi:hypothetical protein
VFTKVSTSRQVSRMERYQAGSIEIIDNFLVIYYCSLIITDQ